MEKELYLIYIERLNTIPNAKGMYEYEFYFSESPEIAWGNDWNEPCPSACNKELMRPESNLYNEIKKLYSIYPIKSIIENSCFSIQDSVDGIVAVGWEDISGYEEYPEPIRLVFNFGESLESVEDKLAQRHQFFSRNNNDNNEDENGGEIDNL